LVAGVAMIAGMVIGFVQAIQDWRAGRPIGVEQPARSVVNAVPVAAEVRARVMARDGFACVHCGSESDLTVDHIVPRSLGGGNQPENLQTLCRRHNSQKATRDMVDAPIDAQHAIVALWRDERIASRNGHH